MAEARGRVEWGQTSALMAAVVNCHVAKKSQMVRPEDLNPYTRLDRRKKAIKVTDMGTLKDAFIGGKG